MEEEKIELYIKELRPDIYLLDEGHEVSGYLVIGEDKACVIDTMNGNNDLGEAVRKLTDKPVFVVNTHGHPDHIYGNVYFDEAYINPKDIPLAEMFINDPEFQKCCQKAGRFMPPFKEIKGGDVIDLGGKTLEVYELPGHTPGGILLLLKEDRILFVGDSINHHLWMQLDGCPEMSDFVKALDKVMFLEDKADLILHGHARDFDDISLMRCMRDGCTEIAEGKTGDDEIYNWFDGVGMQHKFSLVPGKKYSQEDSVVCYTPRHKKLAVIFPGVGYNQDKPLLYYSSKLVRSKGYDIINISYQNIPSGIMGDAAAGKKAAEIAYAQAEEQLSGTDFSKYDDIVFIGKSMGTVVSAIYVMNHKIGAKQIWYTPVEATFGFGTKDAVAFIGNADPWSNYEDVKALASKAGITLHTYPGRNHSLESGFVDTDCRTVNDVISKTSEYISQR